MGRFEVATNSFSIESTKKISIYPSHVCFNPSSYFLLAKKCLPMLLVLSMFLEAAIYFFNSVKLNSLIILLTELTEWNRKVAFKVRNTSTTNGGSVLFLFVRQLYFMQATGANLRVASRASARNCCRRHLKNVFSFFHGFQPPTKIQKGKF